MYGLTRESILAVESPPGTEQEPRLLGHVRVLATRPFESVVEPCAHEGAARVDDLPPLSTCRPVFIDFGLRRLRLALVTGGERSAAAEKVEKAAKQIAAAKGAQIELVENPQRAEWLVRLDQGKVALVEASGNRAPFALPKPEAPDLGRALRRSLEKIYRASNLIALASRFETERYRGRPSVDVEVELLRHKDRSSRGEVLPRPAEGWTFRPGELISFRIRNRSPSLRVDVTLLIVGADFEIHAFYPRRNDVGKSLAPGGVLETPPPPGQIGDEPPFGMERLVVIATPATNPPANFTALAQDGLEQMRAADRSRALSSPLGELLESAMYRAGSCRGLSRSVADRHSIRVLTWRTEAGNVPR